MPFYLSPYAKQGRPFISPSDPRRNHSLGSLRLPLPVSPRPGCHGTCQAHFLGSLYHQLRLLYRDQPRGDPHLGHPPSCKGRMAKVDHSIRGGHHGFGPLFRCRKYPDGPRETRPDVEHHPIPSISSHPCFGMSRVSRFISPPVPSIFSFR